MVSNALKVSLVFEGLKFQGNISKSTRVTLDFIRLKGKMAPAAIETVVSNLEQNKEELKDVFITGLADAIRWVDRLLGAFTISAWVITLDLKKGYQQMNLDTGSCEHKSFTTLMGLYKRKVLPLVM